MRYAQPNGSALQKILQPVRRGLEVIEFLGLPLSGEVSAPLGFSRSLVFETRPMRERERDGAYVFPDSRRSILTSVIPSLICPVVRIKT